METTEYFNIATTESGLVHSARWIEGYDNFTEANGWKGEPTGTVTLKVRCNSYPKSWKETTGPVSCTRCAKVAASTRAVAA